MRHCTSCTPASVIAEFGADTFRLYEMYMGRLGASKPWNTRDIVGVYRFLQRAWQLLIDETNGETKLRSEKHDAVKTQTRGPPIFRFWVFVKAQPVSVLTGLPSVII